MSQIAEIRTEPHPSGGTFTFYDLGDGRHASILDDKYPYAVGFEIHLRGEDDSITPGTEQHESTMKAAIAYLDRLAETSPSA